jgi:hypothetical protein
MIIQSDECSMSIQNLKKFGDFVSRIKFNQIQLLDLMCYKNVELKLNFG